MDIVAVLRQEFAVAGIESQTISTSLQLGHIVVTFPIFIAGDLMWVEAEIVWTFEVLLCWNCNNKTRIINQRRQRQQGAVQQFTYYGIGSLLSWKTAIWDTFRIRF